MTHLGVDVEYWGVPLSWITYVIPTRFRHVDWLNFIADLAFWAVIASLVTMSFLCYRSKRDSSKPLAVKVASGEPHARN
jgi:hypothetical protein